MKIPYIIQPRDAQFLTALFKGETPSQDRTNEELISLLTETLKLADSIANNCKEWLETMAIVHADYHPYTAEKLNYPTLQGALDCAANIPRVNPKGTCATCAFRIGSPPNQCDEVAEDVLDCLLEGRTFMCHCSTDDSDEEPNKPCKGFLKAKARIFNNKTTK